MAMQEEVHTFSCKTTLVRYYFLVMTIESFAEKNRLRLRRDEDDENVVPGRKGVLYVENGRLCALGLAATITPSLVQAIACRRCWIGDKWTDTSKGVTRTRRDWWLQDIEDRDHAKAVRLVGAYRKKRLSQEHLAVFLKAGEPQRLKLKQARASKLQGGKKGDGEA